MLPSSLDLLTSCRYLSAMMHRLGLQTLPELAPESVPPPTTGDDEATWQFVNGTASSTDSDDEVAHVENTESHVVAHAPEDGAVNEQADGGLSGYSATIFCSFVFCSAYIAFTLSDLADKLASLHVVADIRSAYRSILNKTSAATSAVAKAMLEVRAHRGLHTPMSRLLVPANRRLLRQAAVGPTAGSSISQQRADCRSLMRRVSPRSGCTPCSPRASSGQSSASPSRSGRACSGRARWACAPSRSSRPAQNCSAS